MMRWLINYIRSCFCKHELKEKIGYELYHKAGMEFWHRRTFTTLYCLRCGYSKKIRTGNIEE